MSAPPLRNDRVHLTPPDDHDLAFLVRFANDAHLRGWLRFERPMTETDERAWIRGLGGGADERAWIIRDGRRPIGVIGLSGWHRVARHAELGLGILDEADRGRGWGEAAVRLVLDHAFSEMGLQKVHLSVLDDNPAIRLYARLGFREEGRLRRQSFKRGSYHDDIKMGLLREEWRP